MNAFVEELVLLSGEPVMFGNIYVKHPTLREIVDYGEDNYYQSIGLFTQKPFDLKGQLYLDKKTMYTDVDEFDLFLSLYYHRSFGDKYKWLIGDYDFIIEMDDNNQKYLIDKRNGGKIDRLIYCQISQYLRDMNGIKQELSPGNLTAKIMLIKQEAASLKRSRKRKKKSMLSKYIKNIIWNKYSNYKYDDIWDLKIYQFIDGLSVISKNDNRDNTMIGIYTGNIDSKKFDFSKIELFS